MLPLTLIKILQDDFRPAEWLTLTLILLSGYEKSSLLFFAIIIIAQDENFDSFQKGAEIRRYCIVFLALY